jgi:gastric intrinsic factor
LQQILDLEDSLSVKQMEVDILVMLHKHRTAIVPKPMEMDRLARYILSLTALCKDVRSFHGNDLVTLLQHHEPQQDDEFALSALAACSSQAHVRKRQIRRLLDVASGEITNVGVYNENRANFLQLFCDTYFLCLLADTMAMVLLALRCIITDHRHRHLQHFIRRPALGLAALQGPRGSFGSLRSTALAMQALQDLPLDGTTYNRSVSSKWILERQRSDGGWSEEPVHDGQDPNVGVALTADIILALGCKGLGAVRALQCDHVIRDTPVGNGENGDNGDKSYPPPPVPPSSLEDSEQKNVSYTYTLWLETNITDVFSLALVSPKNTSFFKAMTQAADQDPR